MSIKTINKRIFKMLLLLQKWVLKMKKKKINWSKSTSKNICELNYIFKIPESAFLSLQKKQLKQAKQFHQTI